MLGVGFYRGLMDYNASRSSYCCGPLIAAVATTFFLIKKQQKIKKEGMLPPARPYSRPAPSFGRAHAPFMK